MAQVQLDVPYNEGPRNRGTVAIRIILAIPHLLIVGVWGYVIEFVAVIHWFIQVFTGKRNQGLFNFSNKYLDYASRVPTPTPGCCSTSTRGSSTTPARRRCSTTSTTTSRSTG